MRVFALFLLAFGAVLGVVGLIGTIVAVRQLPAGGPPDLLFLFVAFLFVGVSLLVGAVSILRRTKPVGAVPPVVDGKVGAYAPNQVVSGTLDGVPYDVLYTPPVRGKHARPSSLSITVPVETSGEFEIVPESRFDRFCKRLGVAVEIQTGDEVFDAESYVRSDAVEFTEAYLADPVKRIAILDVRRLGFPVVTMDDGDLSALWSGFDPLKHDRPDLVADAAARLVLLARNLPPHRPEFENRWGRHRKRWQTVLWVCLGLFALTIFSLIAYPPIRAAELFGTAAFVFVPGLPIFSLLGAMLLRGTSTSHHAWGGLMIGALLLFPVGSTGAVALLNGVLDDSRPVTHTAVIVEKHTSRSKNSTNYHVKCQSWRPEGGTESFQVSSADYNAVRENRSNMVVTTRAGRFGVEWLDGKRVVP